MELANIDVPLCKNDGGQSTWLNAARPEQPVFNEHRRHRYGQSTRTSKGDLVSQDTEYYLRCIATTHICKSKNLQGLDRACRMWAPSSRNKVCLRDGPLISIFERFLPSRWSFRQPTGLPRFRTLLRFAFPFHGIAEQEHVEAYSRSCHHGGGRLADGSQTHLSHVMSREISLSYTPMQTSLHSIAS